MSQKAAAFCHTSRQCCSSHWLHPLVLRSPANGFRRLYSHAVARCWWCEPNPALPALFHPKPSATQNPNNLSPISSEGICLVLKETFYFPRDYSTIRYVNLCQSMQHILFLFGPLKHIQVICIILYNIHGFRG